MLKFKAWIGRCFCLLALTLSGLSSFGAEAPTVWEVLQKQFKLDHEVTRPEVQTQIRWLVAHPSYLRKLAQSEPYIYHIITEIKKRQLPGEIALIPMLESAYDPFAYSGAGAAGLWQMMPGTGTNLGLKQDWWFDGRRSIRPATDAALNYLAYLNKFFNGNWLLAFAAYDSGEGTIAKLIKSNPHNTKASFWSLAVPQETRAYVPRLLALAEIIQNPKRYHVELPDIPHLPYFEEVNIGSQIDLNHAAKLAGISYKELIQLNPGYNRWATAPYRPYKLLIPVEHVDDFRENLANVPEDQRVSLTTHKVSAGDSLVIIAKKYHTTVNLIKELNQLKSTSVKNGQVVLIPSSKNTELPANSSKKSDETKSETQFTEAKEYKVLHIVQKKETYQSIASKYGVTLEQIKQWNNQATEVPLKPGLQLTIWKKSSSKGVYIVKSGDNLSSIAKANHTKVRVLLSLNPSLQKNKIKIGQKIVLG